MDGYKKVLNPAACVQVWGVGASISQLSVHGQFSSSLQLSCCGLWTVDCVLVVILSVGSRSHTAAQIFRYCYLPVSNRDGERDGGEKSGGEGCPLNLPLSRQLDK